MRGVYCRVDCVCEVCGAVFTADRARAERAKVRFCSRKCMGQARSGSNHVGWKGGIEKDGNYLKTWNGKREHIEVAERATGKPLPDGAVVHHHDGDGRNNKNSNLVICQDGAYHRLIHARQNVLNLGGNPNTDKFCGTCGRVKHASAFSPRKAGYLGKSSECRFCATDRQRKAKLKKNPRVEIEIEECL